ncbi:hypothetical protein QYM36_017040 [Artemia franciscana]|uniref:Surfeit locus protein 4 homolog n=1 Tax=Artemia franciscana TaxID=6661 RepID=A0AA88H4R3_ARTSF|nr:hypothetical protein QYM36_017040 [Artemia franciscana]
MRSANLKLDVVCVKDSQGKMSKIQQLIDRGEEITGKILYRLKPLLPTMFRLLLLSTFLEDSIHIALEPGAQTDYIDIVWDFGEVVAHLIVFWCFCGQVFGSLMILFRFRVAAACGWLFTVVIIHSLAFGTLWGRQFISANIALLGGLFLLLAEAYTETRSDIPGLPHSGQNTHKWYLQLAGRILLLFMFLSVTNFDFSLLEILKNCIAWTLIVLIAIGYKTRLSAITLVLWLLAWNFYQHPYWNIPPYDNQLRDAIKYDFFKTLSVIGGFLMVVLHGPGGVSLDEKDKLL